MSDYDIFHSQRPHSLSREVICVRSDLTYVHHTVQEHNDNEYLCVTVKHKKCEVTIIGAYLAPPSSLNKERLNDILHALPPPFLLTGDFNAHRPIWTSSHMNARGRNSVHHTSYHNLIPLNDDSPTFVRSPGYSSSLDVTFVSYKLFYRCNWITDVGTHGSDHIPTYTSLASFAGLLKNRTITPVNWSDFGGIMESSSTSQGSLDGFSKAPLMAAKQAPKTCSIPRHRLPVDSQYERLRATRMRAERRTRKTQNSTNWTTARTMQKSVRRHLDKLGRTN